MKFLFALSIVFLGGCTLQAGLAAPKDTFSKEEVSAGLNNIAQAVVALDARIKALEPKKETKNGKEEIKK